MTRLIDANALKYDFGEIDDGLCKRTEFYVTDTAIAKQPTVDAIPIDYLQSQVDSGKWEEIITRWKEVDTPTVDTPTVDIEPQWIPCSERMPNDDKDCLVTDGESMSVGYYRTDAKAWDNVNFGWLEHREETCGLKPVVAWMPLPKPYEGDKE